MAQVLEDEIRRHLQKRLDVELGISYGPVIKLGNTLSALEWISQKIGDIENIAEALGRTLNEGVEKAVGPKGQPGDIHRIVHVGNRLGAGYEALLDWRGEFDRIDSAPELENLLALGALFSQNIIAEIEEFALGMRGRIEAALESPKEGDVLTLKLTMTVPDMTGFHKEMQRLARTMVE